jgi:hypothetical protein
VGAAIPGYSARRMTEDIRRLRRKGLIRVSGSQRYELANHHRRIAVFFTKTDTRLLNAFVSDLDLTLPEQIARRLRLARAWRVYERAVAARIANAHLASREDDSVVNDSGATDSPMAR